MLHLLISGILTILTVMSFSGPDNLISFIALVYSATSLLCWLIERSYKAEEGALAQKTLEHNHFSPRDSAAGFNLLTLFGTLFVVLF